MWTWRSRNSWILHQKLRDESVFMQGWERGDFQTFCSKIPGDLIGISSLLFVFILKCYVPLWSIETIIYIPLGKITCVQARSHGWVGGVGGCDTPPKSAKRSTFSHKIGQNGGQEGMRVKMGEVQKVHFWGPKGPLFLGPAPPNQSWLRACLCSPKFLHSPYLG